MRKICLVTLVLMFLISAVSCSNKKVCEHQYGPWIVMENATCTSEGKKERVCSFCNEKEYSAIKVLAHNWQNTDCEKPRLCSSCKMEDSSKLEHTFIEISRTVFCEIVGNAEYKCSQCGKIKSEDILPTGHDWIEASCTDSKKCSVCNVTEGDPLGHLWDNNKYCLRCNTSALIDICPVDFQQYIYFYGDEGNINACIRFPEDLHYETENVVIDYFWNNYCKVSIIDNETTTYLNNPGYSGVGYTINHSSGLKAGDRITVETNIQKKGIRGNQSYTVPEIGKHIERKDQITEYVINDIYNFVIDNSSCYFFEVKDVKAVGLLIGKEKDPEKKDSNLCVIVEYKEPYSNKAWYKAFEVPYVYIASYGTYIPKYYSDADGIVINLKEVLTGKYTDYSELSEIKSYLMSNDNNLDYTYEVVAELTD